MRTSAPTTIVHLLLFAAIGCVCLLAARPALAQTEQLGRVNHNANLRAGPGTNYKVIGSAREGQTVTIVGSNPAATWLHLKTGQWIAAFLVDELPSSSPSPSPDSAPAAGTAPTPGAAPASAGPASSGPAGSFAVVDRRLWDVYENGGSLDGPSVHCGDKRNLFVHVLDADGHRLNGVAVQAQYGAREIVVTGSQGKGDGVAEFVLGSGQEVKVIRDETGQSVQSEVAAGLSTNPANIDQPSLIAAGYCQDDESCRAFAAGGGCLGHFSWSVTFQRR